MLACLVLLVFESAYPALKYFAIRRLTPLCFGHVRLVRSRQQMLACLVLLVFENTLLLCESLV